jgi:4-diphosphocytidyl-2-C-methyl-D-erythritol kinase
MKDLQTGSFTLVKHLPTAAGIGGGSSDAAAALRLLAQHNGLSLDDPRVMQAAQMTGADVPVCLRPSARMMQGIGDVLGPDLALPPLYAVLVNPSIPLQTAQVFTQLGLERGTNSGLSAHPIIPTDPDTLILSLKNNSNDLQDAAEVLVPVIRDICAILWAARGCQLARMSGSGATCFGLFKTRSQASQAATLIRRTHQDWWVHGCILH